MGIPGELAWKGVDVKSVEKEWEKFRDMVKKCTIEVWA